MRSQHLPMTSGAFECMPRQLGWKYEYWDGCAHISPSYRIVTTAVEIQPCPVITPCQMRAVERADEAQLISAYFIAFKDAIEYCDWKPAKILDSARKDIQNFLTGKRGKPHPSSRVAVAPLLPSPFGRGAGGEGSLVGAALIIEKRDGQLLLDMLFVNPAWQRKGVATALVSEAVNALYHAGVKKLESRYLLGNQESQAWHQKFGFVEVPDVFLARVYYHHAQHELWRRERVGNLTEAERRKLSAEIDGWKAQIDELETIAEQKGLAAVIPDL